MKIRIAGSVNDSIVDGPGLRFTVFTQGCPHRCEGCHNPQTHDFGGGTLVDTEELIAQMGGNPLLSGLTLSGGEPFAQSAACAKLARAARGMGLNVWVYSGYTFEELVAANRPEDRALLEWSDVLVDGRFEMAQRTLEKRFVGSRNQRLLDARRSLAEGRAVPARL